LGYRYHETKRECPNVISLDQTLHLIARIEQYKAKQASKKPKNTSKRSQEQCAKCKGKGHTALEMHENGAYKVRTSIQVSSNSKHVESKANPIKSAPSV
jgi:predicted methyltransferase